MDEGEQSIDDKKEIKQLRATSGRIHRRSLITALVATLVALAFPAS